MSALARIAALLVLTSLVYAQTHQDALDYYPLAVGNYWEYEYKGPKDYSDEVYYTYYSREVIGDSIITETGKRYAIIKEMELPVTNESNIYFDFIRIDTANGILYEYDNVSKKEKKIDSLSASVGDTVTFGRFMHNPPGKTYCSSIYTVAYNGKPITKKKYEVIHESAKSYYHYFKGLGLAYTSVDGEGAITYILKYAKIGNRVWGKPIHMPLSHKQQEDLKYYPLEVGDYWQYEKVYLAYNPYVKNINHYSLEVVSDTLMSNGYYYKVIEEKSIPENYKRNRYERIDSTDGRVYAYVGVENHPGGEYPIDSLFAELENEYTATRIEPYHEGLIPFTTYTGNDTMHVGGEAYDIKIFGDHHSPDVHQNYWLAKGLGYAGNSTEDHFNWSYSDEKLIFAIIEGISFGNPLVSVKEESNAVPNEYSLNQNYPNPFNPATTISYALPNGGDVTLKIYNTMGQLVRTLVNGYQTAGYEQVEFNAAGLASGVYFYRITAGDFVETKKMLLLK